MWPKGAIQRGACGSPCPPELGTQHYEGHGNPQAQHPRGPPLKAEASRPHLTEPHPPLLCTLCPQQEKPGEVTRVCGVPNLGGVPENFLDRGPTSSVPPTQCLHIPLLCRGNREADFHQAPPPCNQHCPSTPVPLWTALGGVAAAHRGEFSGQLWLLDHWSLQSSGGRDLPRAPGVGLGRW